MFVDIILPVPLEQTFTYHVPSEFLGRIAVGVRVVVPFGKTKQYSGIVTDVHEGQPEGDFAIKDIIDVLDDHPLLTPEQLQLWKWMAFYYMCPIGDVYKAALPAGLKLTSESEVVINEDFSDWASLSSKEMLIVGFLQQKKTISASQLQHKFKELHILSAVRSLISKNVLFIKETIDSSFKPRKETHVRLSSAYLSKESLEQLETSLEKTPKRQQLLQHYVSLAGVSAAFSLQNRQLIKEVSRAELMASSGISTAVFASMLAKGIFETYDFEVGRLNVKDVETCPQLPLSGAQQKAFDEICRCFLSKPVCLLHGVTSSGKTEIYIRLIREQLAQGHQVLYLLPEIALTTQITTRLRRIFGNEMGVYHSKFPDNERVEIWKKQRSSQPYNLIVGVRSSLFLPFNNLGLIIVDEEHETSYKQQDPAPRYNARDTAIVLASVFKAHVLLGTATPSFESYKNAKEGKYGLVELQHRFGDVQLPVIEVADVKELIRTKQMKPPFSPRLEEEITQALSRHEQVILFQNRRGYAPVVECATCGWTPTCDTCDVSLTYHQETHQLVCHYCGKTYPMPTVCPACESHDLRSWGYGTEKIEEEVHKRFPQARTARLDFDSTRSRTAYEKTINDFAVGKTDILIGTQMVSKGLDFNNVRVVGILNADTMLSQPDFRSFERSFQMMSQVAGRAGRRGKQGYVILQTKHADYTVISQVVGNDYEAMYQEQMAEREQFHYPPFYRLFYIYLKHRDERTVAEAADILGRMLRQTLGDRILGPDKPAVSRLQLLYIRKIALKAENGISAQKLRGYLLEIMQKLKALPTFSGLQIYFDVDPLQ